MPKISVVTPIYNASAHLEETLDSVRRQTFTDWEYILVDDGSTDDSVDLATGYVARDKRIRLVCQANEGVVAARNRGIQESDPSAKYLILLDHDDLWEMDTLQVLWNTLQAKPGSVGAHGLPFFIDGRGQPTSGVIGAEIPPAREGFVENRMIPWPSQSPTTFAVMACANCIVTPGQVLIRRSVLDNVGLLDSACRPADDWDLWLRLTRLGDIAFVNRIVINYRVHQNNVSHNRRVMDQAGWTVRCKTLRASENTHEQRALARLGIRVSTLLICRRRLFWARNHWKKREIISAIKQLRHALKHFLRTLLYH